MKNVIRISAVLLTLALSSALLCGCGSVRDESSEEKVDSIEIRHENGAVVSVSIHENGSEDGRNVQWEVYDEDSKHYVSYDDEYQGETGPDEVYELTDEEYSDVMSCDYDKYIAEYDPKNFEGDDIMHYDSTVRYENGKEVITKASMYDACEKLYKIRSEHKK